MDARYGSYTQVKPKLIIHMQMCTCTCAPFSKMLGAFVSLATHIFIQYKPLCHVKDSLRTTSSRATKIHQILQKPTFC